MSEAEKHRVLSQHGASRQSSINQIGVDVLSFPGNADALLKAIEMSGERALQFVEPDYFADPCLTPNDPWWGAQQWGLQTIGCPTAWGITQGNSSTVIAILDSGVYAAHPDLSSQLVPGWNASSNNSDTSDNTGHGTVVAGVAGAATNNGVGIAGVAWNCKLMPVRITDSSGNASYSAIASGLTWAADHGARVANISYQLTSSATVDSAANYFRSKGGVVVTGAGNTGLNSGWTTNDAYMLTVGATDYYDNIYSWSTWGPNLDLCAPGADQSTTISGGYAAATGTSVSSPYVAGVAALVISENPGLSASQVESILTSTAKDLGGPGWDQYYGYGRVDAGAAVAKAQSMLGVDTTPPSVSFTQPSNGQTVAGTVTVFASASDNNQMGSVTFYVDGIMATQLLAGPYQFNWDTTAVADGAHTLMAVATDMSNNSSSASISVIVSNGDSVAPSVNLTSPGNGSSVQGSISVTATASDNVGVTSVLFLVDGVQVGSSGAAPYSFNWNSGSVGNGTHTVSAKALDAAGNSSTSSVSVTVNNPDTVAPSVNLTAPGNGATVSGPVSMSASASDNVGVTSVSFYCDGALLATDTASPYTYSWDSTSVANGTHTLSAVAKDAAGNSSTSSVSVTVSNSVIVTTILSINITSPANGTVITKMSTLKVSSSVSDNSSTVTKVEMYLDGKLVATATTSPWTCSYSTRKIASGSHSVYTKMYDAAGNTAVSQTISVTK